jgi:hypothetical protein
LLAGLADQAGVVSSNKSRSAARAQREGCKMDKTRMKKLLFGCKGMVKG